MTSSPKSIKRKNLKYYRQIDLNFQSSSQTTTTHTTIDNLKIVTVKGITCSKDLKMNSANVEKVKGVSSCNVGKQGTTTIFEVKYNYCCPR